MARFVRIVILLTLAVITVAPSASAAVPPTTQYFGGWAKPALPGSTTNADGFIPAPRTPNMIWQSSLIADPIWSAGFTSADLAFKGKYMFNADYEYFRIVDISNPRNPVTVANQFCPGSQGDLVVIDNLVVRGHEGTHGVPFGDLNRACEVGGPEIQTVALTGFDTNGDSFRLSYNGNQSAAIVRGTNFTTAGIQQAIQGRNEVQNVAFTGFNSTNSSFRVRIGGNDSAVIGSGGATYNNAGIAAAINAIPGFAGTVTVANAGNGGFNVTFGGASAASDVALLEIVNLTCPAACTANVTTTTTSIAAMPGWTPGATVTVGSLSDTGFTLTFGGAFATVDVAPFSVASGTGGTSGTVTETRKGTPAPAWRGITIHDVSNPANPRFVKAVSICGSTHTITRYFDDKTNTMYVFGSGGGTNTNRPDYGLTECSSLPGSRGDVVEIPRDNPSQARLLQHNYIPMGFGNGSCHDSDSFEELHLIAVACAGGGGASLVDVSDFKNPKVVWTYTYPGLITTHSAAFSWDGRYVYVNGEPGGGGGAECAFDDDTTKPMIHIIDTKTGKLVGMWMLPRPQDRVGEENCTTHTINVVPIVGRHLIASSCYMCGINVIDATNPRAPREIAYVDPIAPQPGQGAAADGCWTGYWYNDNLYCSELDWGSHIFTLSDPWWKQAMTFEELNPQTFTRLIRCDVSVRGVPARAGRNGRITVRANLFGPAPRQPGWGLKVAVSGPGISKRLTTGENGTVSARVRANRAGRLRVAVPPAANLPFGCTASKRIAAAPKKARRGDSRGGGAGALTGRAR